MFEIDEVETVGAQNVRNPCLHCVDVFVRQTRYRHIRNRMRVKIVPGDGTEEVCLMSAQTSQVLACTPGLLDECCFAFGE